MFDMFENMNSSDSESSSVSSYSGKTFVVSAGGSIFFKQKPDSGLLKEFASCIEELKTEGYKFVIVVGGGQVARNYCEAASELGMNNFAIDKVAIEITRANASLMLGSLKDAHQEVLTDISKAKQVLDSGKIAVFGGLMPSLTTDAVGVLIAEFLDASFINLTNVDGIYNKDPSKHDDAELYEKINHDKLIQVLKKASSKPGQNFVLDMPSCLILRRSNIRAGVMDGSDLENFKSFVRGQSFTGTLIEDFEETEEDEDSVGKDKPVRRTPKTAKKKTAVKKSKDLDPSEIDF